VDCIKRTGPQGENSPEEQEGFGPFSKKTILPQAAFSVEGITSEKKSLSDPSNERAGRETANRRPEETPSSKKICVGRDMKLVVQRLVGGGENARTIGLKVRMGGGLP